MNNKQRGNRFELYCIKQLQPYYKDKLFTTRNISTYLDGLKVDITNASQTLDVNFQCKTTASNINYHLILQSMPVDKPNIIIHRKTRKSVKTFTTESELVVMTLTDFLVLFKTIRFNEDISNMC